jgi:single cache domain-containing protein
MKLLTLFLLLMLCASIFAGVEATDDNAVTMVENTATNLENDIKKTIKEIFSGNEQYWPRKDRQFYVFIMDEHARVIVCPQLRFIGRSYKGMKDARGKKFRDETIENAFKKNKGWMNFSIRSRGKIKAKKTYFQFVKGSDGKNYIVCCDMAVKEEQQK